MPSLSETSPSWLAVWISEDLTLSRIFTHKHLNGVEKVDGLREPKHNSLKLVELFGFDHMCDPCWNNVLTLHAHGNVEFVSYNAFLFQEKKCLWGKKHGCFALSFLPHPTSTQQKENNLGMGWLFSPFLLVFLDMNDG